MRALLLALWLALAAAPVAAQLFWGNQDLLDPDGRPLTGVAMPRGKVKEDPFFGKQETFRDFVRMRLPISAADAAKGSVTLKVTSQGCSDKGVCYVPQTQDVTVQLPRS